MEEHRATQSQSYEGGQVPSAVCKCENEGNVAKGVLHPAYPGYENFTKNWQAFNGNVLFGITWSYT